MKLIAAGRASEIFDLDDGRVLRRFKAGGDPEREALVMRHALSAGYPAPRVLEVTTDSLVLERIEGPTMLDAVLRRRSTLRVADSNVTTAERQAVARLVRDVSQHRYQGRTTA